MGIAMPVGAHSGSVVVRLAKSALIFVTALQAALRANTGSSARHEGPPSGQNARLRVGVRKNPWGPDSGLYAPHPPAIPIAPYSLGYRTPARTHEKLLQEAA